MTNQTNTDTDRFAEQRRLIVRSLQEQGISDRRVLEAMARVPRERFVLGQLREAAYQDRALPIECRQTISQPFTVAFMCQALGLRGDEKVLEIGTGSGYDAAVLAELAAEVYSIERIPQLADSARQRLEELGHHNVHVMIGDGTLGWPEAAPFDAINVTAGAESLPAPYLEQLAAGGRIVIPLGPRGGQEICRFTRTPEGLTEEDLGPFIFVPLIGKHGWGQDQE